MTLRIRHLRLRASTTEGVYGVDLQFGPGLTVVWADNTKGKSTCMQGMLYALGMERMLSPRREVPLPHAMTTYLMTDAGEKLGVLESSASLEIENGAGEVITVHRAIKSQLDRRLISVDFGSALVDGTKNLRRRDFFVIDPGAASREDGFHHFLEGFLGWSLPMVRSYDAPETKLYLETIFPLFWVEQKTGWSSIPATIPTYLRIREVHKRAIEFIMDLDVHRLELHRQQLDDLFAANKREWRALWDEMERIAVRLGGRTAILPQTPIADDDELSRAHVIIAEHSSEVPLSDVLVRLRFRVNEIAALAVPEIAANSEHLVSELRRLNENVGAINAQRITIHNSRELKAADIGSLRRRIRSLADDLQKNQDVRKLQRFSGRIADLTLIVAQHVSSLSLILCFRKTL